MMKRITPLFSLALVISLLIVATPSAYVKFDFLYFYVGPVQGCTEKSSDKDMKLSMLVEMGFPLDEASSAIDRCGIMFASGSLLISLACSLLFLPCFVGKNLSSSFES